MASNSEGSGSGIEPRSPALGTQVMDLNDQFEQQQSAINELKEGLEKSYQEKTGKEKELEGYASKLNSIKSRSRTSNRSPRPGASSGPGPPSSPRSLPGALPMAGAVEPNVTPHKDADKLTPSKSLLLLRQKVNENKLILEQRGREQTESKRGVAEMLERLKTQLEERDSTIQTLQTKLSSPDVTGRLHHGTGASVDAARKHLNMSDQGNTLQNDVEENASPTQNRKLTELNDKVIELQGVIVGLQENLLEKDSVINARTKAIALMSEDLCRKGKSTVDELEETKKEMRLMQNNFVQFEADMNKEKAELCAQIESRDQRLHQLEDTNNELITIRNELTARVSELQADRAKPPEDANALAEANKQIVKLKALTKKQLKQINVLKDSADSNNAAEMQRKLAELEEARSNVQLKLVDLEDLQVTEAVSLKRVAELQGELKNKLTLAEELLLQLDPSRELIHENNQLDDQIKLTKDSAKLRAAHLGEDAVKISHEIACIEESLAEKRAGLTHIPQIVQKESQGIATQTPDNVTLEVSPKTYGKEPELTNVGTQTINETVMTAVATKSNHSNEITEIETMIHTSDGIHPDSLKADAINNASIALADLHSLQRVLSEAEAKIEKSKADLEIKDENIKDLKSKMEKELEACSSKNVLLAEKIKKLTITLKSKNAQINGNQLELKELKTTLAKRDKIISELKSEKEELKKASQTSLVRSKEAAAQWDAEKLVLQNIIKNHEEVEQTNRNDTSEIRLRMEEAEAIVRSTTSQLSSQQEELDQLRSILQEREGYIQTLLQERESRDSEFRLAMNTIQKQNAEYMSEISRLGGQCSSNEKELAVANETRSKLENELIMVRMETTEIEGRLLQMLAAKDAKLEEQQAVLEEIGNQYAATKEKADRIESDLFEKIECEEKLKADNNKLQEISKQSQIFIQESDNIRCSLEQQLAAADSEIKALRLLLSEQEGSTTESNSLVSNLEAQVLKHQRLLAVAQQKLDELMAENLRLATVEQDLIATSEKLVASESDFKRTTGMHVLENNRLVEELEKASANLDSLCTRFKECDLSRRELATKCDKLIEDKKELEKATDELTKAAYQQAALSIDLEMQTENLTQDKETLEQTIEELNQAASKQAALTKDLEMKTEILSQDKISLERALKELNLLASNQAALSIDLEMRTEILSQDKETLEQTIEELNQAASKQAALTKDLEMKTEILSQDKISLERALKELNLVASNQAAHSIDLEVQTEVLSQDKETLEQTIEELNLAAFKQVALTKDLEMQTEILSRDKASTEKALEELNQAALKREALVTELEMQTESLTQDKAFLEKKLAELNKVVYKHEVNMTELAIQCDILTQDKASPTKHEVKSAIIEEATAREVSTATSSAPRQPVQPSEESERSEPDWSWGSEDAILEEIHQHNRRLKAEVEALVAKNAALAEELKNNQSLAGKYNFKMQEMSARNSELVRQLKASENSLDKTMELEYSSQISNLEKDILVLKSEKDVLVTENHKLSTKLEALLWQQSELQEDSARLSAELEWTNKMLVEKDQQLCEVKQINEMKVETADKATITDAEEVDLLKPEESKDSIDHVGQSAMKAEIEKISRHHEDLKHELEAREKELIAMKDSVTFANKQLETFSELTVQNEGLKLDLSARVNENNELAHVLLEQEKSLFEANSKYLARDREAITLESSIEMKNAEIDALSQELKEHLNVIHLLKAVQKNGQESEQASASAPSASANERRIEREDENKELDHALYRLHQKEVRCDELTIELMQLLEERDTLQLRLSVALRKNEELKNSLHTPGAPEENRTQATSAADASATTEPGQGVLANKLDQLRSVGLEQRHMALQQQQRGDVALDANYMPREQEPEQESFFQWIWGRGTPKVMDI